MKDEFDFEEDEQLDMFCFMDESERNKIIYEESSEDFSTDSSISTPSLMADTINPLCRSCENCQYKAISKHTKELHCTMFDSDIHRTFLECRGFSQKKDNS